MKRKLYTLTALCLASLFVLVLLVWMSQNAVKNGFNRLFPPHVVSERKALNIEYNSYYIAGISNDDIILGNYTNPLRGFRSDLVLRDTASFLLSIPQPCRSHLVQPSLQVNDAGIYIIDGRSSSVLFPDKSTFRYEQFSSINTFSSFKQLSDSCFVLRTYDVELEQQILVKINRPAYKLLHSYELEKKQDGLFSTDGILNYNSDLSMFIYVYYYRNALVQLDTSLSVIRKGTTIDTVKTGKIDVIYLKEENQLSLKEPPLLVNKGSYTEGKWLYIFSGLMADNEHVEAFNHSSVIDVYSLPDGSYRFSFYVPDYMSKNISSFIIKNKFLIAIQGQYLVTYKFDHSSYLAEHDVNQ